MERKENLASSTTTHRPTTTTTSLTGTQNPLLSNPPGPIKARYIANSGTEEEKAQLAEYLDSVMTPQDRAFATRKAEYGESLVKDKEGPSSEQRLTAAGARLYRTMMRGRATGCDATLPPSELYNVSRSLLWTAYKIQVMNETGAAPIVSRDSPLANALAQVAHWLVGLKAWYGPEGGVCIDPLKSLYLFGGVGTGKSTLAIAAHFASRQLNGEYKTGLSLGLAAMDQVITKVYGEKTLEPVMELGKGSLVIDELRLKHVAYKHFGNDVSIVADILLNRHHVWKQEGRQTIITTNVPVKTGSRDRPGLVEALNDDRITDRLFQQYHIIKIDGESFRNSTKTNI